MNTKSKIGLIIAIVVAVTIAVVFLSFIHNSGGMTGEYTVYEPETTEYKVEIYTYVLMGINLQ